MADRHGCVHWLALLTELPTLVWEFKSIDSDDETKSNTFYSNSKGEAIIT